MKQCMELTYRLDRGIHQRGKGQGLEYRQCRFHSPEANRGVIPSFANEDRLENGPGSIQKIK